MNNIFLNYHIKKYPKLQKQDKIKLLYQATFGPNHLIEDFTEKKIYKNILKEIKSSKKEAQINENYYEWISEDYVRVNIKKELNIKYLAHAFYSSIAASNNDLDKFKENLNYYLKDEDISNYDFKPMHHSSVYREEYHPHYCLINKSNLTSLMRIIQLDNFLKSLDKHTITALEGKCASGKSTISKNIDDITILHADDFFLNPSLKTKERLNEIGGNINYEAIKEVLLKIKDAWENNINKISFDAYDCMKKAYYKKEIILKDKVLFEGVYSYHPYFNSLIDKCAFVYIDDNTQLQRILLRENSNLFINEWMPLENKYFDHFDFLSNADIII